MKNSKLQFVKTVTLLLILIIIGVWLINFRLIDKSLKICVLDVGQGDSIFIQTPGNRLILIDGGPDQSLERELSKLIPFWRKKIDLVFLTHPHADHMNGLISALNNFSFDHLYINEWGSEARQILEKTKINETFKQDDEIKIGDLTITSLWPPINYQYDPNDLNRGSIVMRVDYHSFSALLTGDYELNESSLVNNSKKLLENIDLLKVPHHGSADAVSSSYLQIMKPSISIISVGEENDFGHPNSKTIELLLNAKSQIFRTDQEGTVCLKTTGKDEIWTIAK